MVEILNRELNREKTKKEFKRVAPIYDFWGKLTESRAADRALEISQLHNHCNVLDVACGTGGFLEKAIRINPDGMNTGIDLSPEMLARAKKRLSKYPGDSYQLLEGDALQLSFASDSFDFLYNNYMVDLMPEEKFSLIASEFYRVLKPGGITVISTFTFGNKPIHGFWRWTAKHFPEILTGCRPVDFKNSLRKANFTIKENITISQNTFPSEVIRAVKPAH